MNKRKILVAAMALCMVAILAVGGSLAYLTDTEQVTNTMTVGNIQINIDEFTYMDEDGDGVREWDKFTDDEFTLYPIDNEQGTKLWNKMVYTANTSTSEDDAYIRTIILFEANSEITAANETGCCFPGLHYSFATNDKAKSNTDGKTYVGSKDTNLDSVVTEETVTIGGKEYYVAVFEEKDGKAIEYDAALYTISGVWMDENVTSEQIDGWGDNVEIIVFSQGIQATGLTHAEAMAELGEVNETNLQTWIKTDNAVINDWTNK